MGIALWIGSGLLAWGLARIVPLRRGSSHGIEALLGIGSGFLAGASATLLDFGGWREPDWRAALFAFFLAFAAIGIARLINAGSPARSAPSAARRS